MKIPFVDYELYISVIKNESLLNKDLESTIGSQAVSLTKAAHQQ